MFYLLLLLHTLWAVTTSLVTKTVTPFAQKKQNTWNTSNLKIWGLRPQILVFIFRVKITVYQIKDKSRWHLHVERKWVVSCSLGWLRSGKFVFLPVRGVVQALALTGWSTHRGVHLNPSACFSVCLPGVSLPHFFTPFSVALTTTSALLSF